MDEEERSDNPMDRVDPPKVPSEIQAYYQAHGVESVVKSIGRSTPHNLRDAAIVMVLYDSGVRASEICGMKVDDLASHNRRHLQALSEAKALVGWENHPVLSATGELNRIRQVQNDIGLILRKGAEAKTCRRA